MNYLFHIVIMIMIYIPVVLGLNLVIGFTGLFSLTQAAFYGIGAYAYTLTLLHFKFPFWVSLLFSIVFTMFIAFLVGYPSLRLKSDYFVLATIGFQFIIFEILYNWVSLTRGPYGIPGIPRPVLFNFRIDTIWKFLIFSSFFGLLSILISYIFYNSPFGLILKGIRDDELSSYALGRDVFKYKMISFVLGAGFAALSGFLYAVYVTYIDPTSFTLDESFFLVSSLIVGGMANLRGPILGVIFMIILPEFLRFVGLPDTIAPNVRQVIYGLVLIILMFKRPQGIGGEWKFE